METTIDKTAMIEEQIGLGYDLFFEFCYVTPYEAALSNCLYLPQFLTDFGQILYSKSYDQAYQTL